VVTQVTTPEHLQQERQLLAAIDVGREQGHALFDPQNPRTSWPRWNQPCCRTRLRSPTSRCGRQLWFFLTGPDGAGAGCGRGR
jgi:hypothetical protein